MSANDTPRDEMRRELMPEVVRAIVVRRMVPDLIAEFPEGWWSTPNDAFGGQTPWAVAQQPDAMDRFDRMIFFLESGVCT